MKILSMSNQAWMFLLTIGAGFIIGFVYDILRILRKIVPHSNIFIHIEDLLYWISVSLFMFYVTLNGNYGEIRAFTIIGAFTGMLLYFFTVSRIILKVSIAVITFIGQILKAAFTILMFPLKIIKNLLSIPAAFLLKIILKNSASVKKVLQKTKRYAKIKSRKTANDFKIILKKQ